MKKETEFNELVDEIDQLRIYAGKIEKLLRNFEPRLAKILGITIERQGPSAIYRTPDGRLFEDLHDALEEILR